MVLAIVTPVLLVPIVPRKYAPMLVRVTVLARPTTLVNVVPVGLDLIVVSRLAPRTVATMVIVSMVPVIVPRIGPSVIVLLVLAPVTVPITDTVSTVHVFATLHGEVLIVPFVLARTNVPAQVNASI